MAVHVLDEKILEGGSRIQLEESTWETRGKQATGYTMRIEWGHGNALTVPSLNYSQPENDNGFSRVFETYSKINTEKDLLNLLTPKRTIKERLLGELFPSLYPEYAD